VVVLPTVKHDVSHKPGRRLPVSLVSSRTAIGHIPECVVCWECIRQQTSVSVGHVVLCCEVVWLVGLLIGPLVQVLDIWPDLPQHLA